jgi:hypothetical protein
MFDPPAEIKALLNAPKEPKAAEDKNAPAKPGEEKKPAAAAPKKEAI